MSSPGRRAVEGPTRVEVLEEVAFVRLIPAHEVGRDGADVQAPDERRLREAAYERGVLRDGRDDERRPERFGDVVLLDLDDAREGKQELAVGERGFGRLTMHDRRQKIRAAFASREAFGTAALSRHV